LSPRSTKSAAQAEIPLAPTERFEEQRQSPRPDARILIASAHERIANARGGDFQHKLSRRLFDENQAICVETLRIKNMQNESLPGQGDRRCRMEELANQD
jgi:hypothetical protein